MNLYIQNPSCVGDIEHNKYIDILLKDIIKSNVSDFILNYLDKEYKTGNWIFDSYNQYDLQRLNSMMKTKNEETLRKRMFNYIDKFECKNYISQLLDLHKMNLINGLVDMLNEDKLVLGE